MLAVFTRLLLFILISISNSLAVPAQSQFSLEDTVYPHPDIPYIFRSAKYYDIDGIADVIIDAFGPSPEWRYHFQFIDKYPVYHRECIRQEIRALWDGFADQNSTFMNVIEVPIDTDGDQEHGIRDSRIVAIGLWELDPSSSETMNDRSSISSFLALPRVRDVISILNPVTTWPNCSLHLDTNSTRAADLGRQFDKAKEKYIDTAYPQGQIYLALLATHPDYDGHNFGATHCRWGLELAKERGLREPVTLMATLVGYPLYRSLGFKNVKNVTLNFLDGLGSAWTQVMEWKYDTATDDAGDEDEDIRVELK